MYLLHLRLTILFVLLQLRNERQAEEKRLLQKMA